MRALPARRAVLFVLVLVIAGAVAGYAATASTPARTPPSAVVGLGTVRGLGRVLVDSEGLTLYLYRPDHDGTSTCTGVCARQWPPLVLPTGVRHPVAGRGVDARLLGTTRRPDGQLQVTYARWPLYRWQGDDEPGQALGEEDDMGLWFAVSPRGKPALPAP